MKIRKMGSPLKFKSTFKTSLKEKSRFINFIFSVWLLIPMHSFAEEPKCHIEKFNLYQMEYCLYKGQGPLVVLESPLGNDLTIWPDTFIKELNKFSEVLVYNRIGYGKSYFLKGKIIEPITAKTSSTYLRSLLDRLAIDKSIILIGHSIGGLYAQYFTRNYQGVAALVLIDASSSLEPKVNSPFQSKIPDKKGSIAYFESAGFNQSMDQVNNSSSFPNIPLLVITATNHGSSKSIETQWQNLQKEMAKQSTQGKQIIATGSGHFIYQDNPDLVIKEVYNLIKKNHIK